MRKRKMKFKKEREGREKRRRSKNELAKCSGKKIRNNNRYGRERNEMRRGSAELKSVSVNITTKMPPK